MAAIDKLYGNRQQFEEFYSWCSKNNKNILKYFNTTHDWNKYDSEEVFSITNFPMEVDKWLVVNCPIRWVVQQILDQYSVESVKDFFEFLEAEE